jgi:hypothetical protein
MVSLVSVVRPFFRSALVVSGIVSGSLASGVAGGAPVAVAATTARAASTPTTAVSRPVCTTSLDDPQQRAATFTVRAARGDTATSFGFTALLEEKPAGGTWAPLKGTSSPAGLGAFQPAADGAAAMVRRINVNGLRMGSAYRLKVSFRWVTPTGKQRVTRRSAPCTVRELRPNLGVTRPLPWTPGTRGDQLVYRTVLRVSRAASFAGRTVTVSVNQGTTLLGQVTLKPLHHGSLVLIPGSACTPDQDITFRIEASPTIEESNSADNELTMPCSPGRAPGR